VCIGKTSLFSVPYCDVELLLLVRDYFVTVINELQLIKNNNKNDCWIKHDSTNKKPSRDMDVCWPT